MYGSDRKTWTRGLAGAAFVAATLSPSVLASDAELLDLVKAGMQRAHQSIKSCKGTVEKTNWELNGEARTVHSKATAAWDGNRMRISVEGLDGAPLKYEGAFDGTNATDWLVRGVPTAPAVRIRKGQKGLAVSDFGAVIDPRRHGIRRLADDVEVKVLRRESINGDDCVVLETRSPALPNGDYHVCKLWVDLTKGFTVPKSEAVEVLGSTGETKARQEYLTDLRQYGPNLWGPAREEITQYDATGVKQWQITLVYAADFKINEPVGEDDLRLTLPSGLEVFDEVLDATYTLP